MGETSTWTGLGSLALLSAWCHGPASPFLPVAFEPVLLAYGRMYPPLTVALVGAAASIVAEAVNYLGYGYLLRHRRLRRVQQVSTRVTAWFARHPFLTCLLAASTPVPDWSVRILGALARYPARRYLLAFALGRVPKFWFIATVGQAVRINPWALAAVVFALLVVAYGGAAFRRLRARPVVSPVSIRA
jgi:uncharacterized membrane protein YdjX (TVP38/TMEM64 family)